MGWMCCMRAKMYVSCDLTEWIPIDQIYFIVGQKLLGNKKKKRKFGADKAV